VTEDINGDIDKTDVVRAKEFGALIIKEVSNSLKQKGYPVIESFISSGCILDA